MADRNAQAVERRMAGSRRAIRVMRRLGALAAAIVLAAAFAGFGSASAAGPETAAASSGTPHAPAADAFTICADQTYALCAAAKCTMFNDVAYCSCDVKKGDSISLTQTFKNGDVCDFNAKGPDNGYMVSTFSTPPSVVKPAGDQAIYTCEASTSDGAYAQCDGGVCFKSSKGQNFPGLGKLENNEIVCACPTVTGDPDTAKIGYQIVGPYPCQDSFFNFCKSSKANTDNGSPLYVGAPTGSAKQLSRKLSGKDFRFNQCVEGG
ncbi:hypothetical protein [Hansschlegelia zhihuaiae]|nr:hypothetical protein [Hansschlegelia zhihuaiae]